MKFILGKKVGMTQIWQGEEVVPVTKIQAGPCLVTQIKTQDKDGYDAVQLGFGQKKDKNIKKPQKGHLNKFSVKPRYLREFRISEQEAAGLETGAKIEAGTFEAGDKVDVAGVSKGRGFQGVVKRYRFAGAIRTHGTKDQERMPGSAGAMGVGRIFPGQRMPGRMGGDRVTVKNLEIVEVDAENNILLVKGSVAGPNQGLVFLKGEGELKVSAVEEEQASPKTQEDTAEETASEEKQEEGSEEKTSEETEAVESQKEQEKASNDNNNPEEPSTNQ